MEKRKIRKKRCNNKPIKVRKIMQKKLKVKIGKNYKKRRKIYKLIRKKNIRKK